METHTGVQFFTIGFSLGISGPCFITCTPFFVAYLAGKNEKWGRGLIMAFVFLAARLGAYLILGFLAGLSGALLGEFSNSSLNLFMRLSGGIVIIILGLFLLFGKESSSHVCRTLSNKPASFGRLSALGFIMGILPCGPYLAILFDSALHAKTGLQGMSYALSFGLGNLISSFISIAGLSGIITWLPVRIQRLNVIMLFFRAMAVLLLVLIGLELILPGIKGMF